MPRATRVADGFAIAETTPFSQAFVGSAYDARFPASLDALVTQPWAHVRRVCALTAGTRRREARCATPRPQA